MGNMYGDSVMQWNFFKGCKYSCRYCEASFKRQAKRQKQNCIDCYYYKPHFHQERLKTSFPQTHGDEFIWACSSGDITFANRAWIQAGIDIIKQHPDKTFFFQSKNPYCFKKWRFPDNVILGITLETNRDEYYKLISNAPLPSERIKDFNNIKHLRKSVTIEPVLKFDVSIFANILLNMNLCRIYIGYDTKKCDLPEPILSDVNRLIAILDPHTKVKTKLMREGVFD